MESNLTKITAAQVFSPGFLWKFKKKKKWCQRFLMHSTVRNENVRAQRCYSAPSLSHHAGKEPSKQMYSCPSQADQARFADLFHMVGVRMMLHVFKLPRSLKNVITVIIRISYSPQPQGENTKQSFRLVIQKNKYFPWFTDNLYMWKDVLRGKQEW